MASKKQVSVGDVVVGGGAPVVVQSMTKTDTSDIEATLNQIDAMSQAGCEIARCAVPRSQDADALVEIVARSPIPIIADIHFNHTLALKAIDAGAHCVRINPGNIGGEDRVAEVVNKARLADIPMRIGVNSGSLPKHLHRLEDENPVEALVAAALEKIELMERLDFDDFKVSIKSTNVTNTVESNRRLADRVEYPIHLGITEAGTKWTGTIKSAVGLGTLLSDGIGDTVRVSLSTFEAEEEVKVAWEILRSLGIRKRGPELIACPTCGRLQFDMDSIVADVEKRLDSYSQQFSVAVLGCAVNGLGEAASADFGITGGKGSGLVFAAGKPLRKVPQASLVDELFAEIDRSLEGDSKNVSSDEAVKAMELLDQIESENRDQLTPEKIASMEKSATEVLERPSKRY